MVMLSDGTKVGRKIILCNTYIHFLQNIFSPGKNYYFCPRKTTSMIKTDIKMKRFLAIPALALAAVAITGCDNGGGVVTPPTTEYIPVPVRTEEISSLTGTTEIRYLINERGTQIGETKTVNGVLIYSDTNFEHSGNELISRDRTLYEEDGETVKGRQHIVQTFGLYDLADQYGTYGVQYKETKYELYTIAEDDSRTLTEVRRSTYDTVGNFTEYTVHVDGQEVLKRWNYGYVTGAGFDYDQREGGEQGTLSSWLYDAAQDGYTLYLYPAGVKNDDDRIRVERMTERDENVDALRISYRMTRYDHDSGAAIDEITHVTQYENVKVTY